MELGWRLYVRVLQFVCATLLAGIVGVTLVNVTMRYVFSSPLVWADESARLAFVVFTFLASGLAAAGGSHLAIDSLAQVLNNRGVSRRAIDFLPWLRRLIGVAFGGLLMIGGWGAATANMSQLSPALQIPMGWAYMALPIGGALIILGEIGDILFPTSRELVRVEGSEIEPVSAEPGVDTSDEGEQS